MNLFLKSFCALIMVCGCVSKSGDRGSQPLIVDVSGKRLNNPAITGDSTIGTSGNTEKLYKLTDPDEEWKLPEDLVEVSGNTWVDDNHLILIEDLHPELYLIQLNGDKADLEKKIPFAETEKDKYDIEDVVLTGNVVYALYSHGTIFRVDGWNGTSPKTETFKTFLKKENNAEGLCYDPVSKKLLVACKEDPGIKGADKFTKAIYSFDPAKGKMDKDPFMVITEDMFKSLNDDKLDFYPSAIGVHPLTNDIYILSTKDTKCLAVFSHDGKKLKSFQYIDKDLMPQPEGICFAPDGTMYISSEGKKGDPGNLFRFKPQQ